MMHISDIHLWFSTSVLKALDKLIAWNSPELIVMTGDYFDLPIGAHHFRDFLCSIAKKHKVLFILGNHDLMYGSTVSKLILGIPNCICVDNTLYQHYSKSRQVYNITSWENRNSLEATTYQKMNIVLIHNPEKIKTKELDNIHLILAGHLHGGQFVFFKTKHNSTFPGNMLYKYCIDRKQMMNTTLIVNKGLGDTFPFRWNCPKEIVMIEIV